MILFVAADEGAEDQPAARAGEMPAWRNKLLSRSLRRFAFIDNRFPKESGYPKKGEHWLVEIVRENLTAKGGCFIVSPIRKVEREEQEELLHGKYALETDGDAVIVVPNDPTKCWVMSPKAKRAILDETPGAKSILIRHQGGTTWPRRRPAESVLETEAKRLLKD